MTTHHATESMDATMAESATTIAKTFGAIVQYRSPEERDVRNVSRPIRKSHN